MNKAKYQDNPSWLGNAAFIAFHTNHASFLQKSKTQSVVAVDFDVLLSTKSPVKLNESHSTMSETCLHTLTTSNVRRISATEELKNFIRKELNLPSHPVVELISTFKQDYQTYSKSFSQNNPSLLTSEKELEEIYQGSIKPIKIITLLLREFLLFIYKEMIISFEQQLYDEDNRYELVIDHLLSQLVFDDINSFLYRHVYKCLELKHRESLKLYRSTLELFRNKSLQEIDGQISDGLILKHCETPYQSIIETISLPRKLANPYLKKDYLATLEDEMVSTINAYNLMHREQTKHKQLEPDEKFAIYTYCLIKSSYANIILDIAFIEEFTQLEENNQSYTRFVGCIHDYILSGDLAQYVPSSSPV